jgi:2'-5' RNA ligase
MRPSAWPSAERLSNHWTWRPEWSCDRPCLWWYLTFRGAPPLRRAAEALGEPLARAGLDVIPPLWLHLTVCEVGFADGVDDARADAVVRAVRRRLAGQRPFRLTLGPVDTLPGAVVLTARPLGSLRALRRQLLLATASVTDLPPGQPSDDAFWPHVSLAYANRPLRRADVLRGLAHPKVQVEVDRVTLAAVTRRDRHYQWRTRGGWRAHRRGSGPADPRPEATAGVTAGFRTSTPSRAGRISGPLVRFPGDDSITLPLRVGMRAGPVGCCVPARFP